MAQSTPALGPTLERIAKRQALYVGYREAAVPLCYVVRGQNQPTGYLWEICGRVFAAVEARLGRALPIVPIAVSDNARAMMLRTGVVDLDCGGEGNTVARQRQLAFSVNLYVNEIRLLVPKSAAGADFSGLDGKRVVTVAGGAAERYLKLAALARGIRVQHLLVPDAAAAMRLLVDGGADAYADEAADLALLRTQAADRFVLLDDVLAAEPIALMLPAGDADWKSLVDEAILSGMRDGEIARRYEKWFQMPIPPTGANLELPMSSGQAAALREPGDQPVN